MFFGVYQDVLVHLPNNKKQDGFFILFQHYIQGFIPVKTLKKTACPRRPPYCGQKTPPAFC